MLPFGDMMKELVPLYLGANAIFQCQSLRNQNVLKKMHLRLKILYLCKIGLFSPQAGWVLSCSISKVFCYYCSSGGTPYSYCGFEARDVCCFVAENAEPVGILPTPSRSRCGKKGFDANHDGEADMAEWPWHVSEHRLVWVTGEREEKCGFNFGGRGKECGRSRLQKMGGVYRVARFLSPILWSMAPGRLVSWLGIPDSMDVVSFKCSNAPGSPDACCLVKKKMDEVSENCWHHFCLGMYLFLHVPCGQVGPCE